MILKTCSRCAETQREALYWVSGAWQRADGVRVAYSHKLCLTCVSAKIAPLQVHSDTDAMTCPSCGIGTADDYDAVYMTWIPKGVGKLHIEAPFCGPCAAIFRIWFQDGARVLEDRDSPIERPSTAARYTGDQVLAALGIKPRDS